MRTLRLSEVQAPAGVGVFEPICGGTKAPWPPPLGTQHLSVCPLQCDTGRPRHSYPLGTVNCPWHVPCLLNEALNFFRASGMSVSFSPVPRRVLHHNRHLINILLTKSVLPVLFNLLCSQGLSFMLVPGTKVSGFVCQQEWQNSDDIMVEFLRTYFLLNS